MPKINQEEYEVLKELDDKWKYLARNNMYGAKLEAHTSRPYKMTDSHWSNGDMRLELLGGEHLFQFIQWEDEEPHNIQELIEEYLYDNRPKLFIDGQEQSFEFIEESEETEVKKDIEWLKSAIQQNLDFYNDNDEEWQMAKVRAYAKSLDLINQLDEPEVLSQEWIDDNKVARINNLRKMTMSDVVPVESLENMLMPKQDEVDRAYKDGYEKGKQHATEKQSEETETVARVLVDYLIASAKLKLALSMEVEELEE